MVAVGDGEEAKAAGSPAGSPATGPAGAKPEGSPAKPEKGAGKVESTDDADAGDLKPGVENNNPAARDTTAGGKESASTADNQSDVNASAQKQAPKADSTCDRCILVVAASAFKSETDSVTAEQLWQEFKEIDTDKNAVAAEKITLRITVDNGPAFRTGKGFEQVFEAPVWEAGPGPGQDGSCREKGDCKGGDWNQEGMLEKINTASCGDGKNGLYFNTGDKLLAEAEWKTGDPQSVHLTSEQIRDSARIVEPAYLGVKVSLNKLSADSILVIFLTHDVEHGSDANSGHWTIMCMDGMSNETKVNSPPPQYTTPPQALEKEELEPNEDDHLRPPQYTKPPQVLEKEEHELNEDDELEHRHRSKSLGPTLQLLPCVICAMLVHFVVVTTDRLTL